MSVCFVAGEAEIPQYLPGEKPGDPDQREHWQETHVLWHECSSHSWITFHPLFSPYFCYHILLLFMVLKGTKELFQAFSYFSLLFMLMSFICLKFSFNVGLI